MIEIINSDVVAWAKAYKGAKFHAVLCDAPYHLTTITKRFGKKGAAPAKYGRDGAFQRASKGFMGKKWDGSGVSFDPDTWHAIGELMYPGAFGMTFGGSRTYHRIAVAIEDAGFIIHPNIFGWLYGQGFPKATRLDHKVEGELSDEWEGHRYGLGALKPALEPIIIFQRPYEGRPIDNMIETGAGALDIDVARLGVDQDNKDVGCVINRNIRHGDDGWGYNDNRAEKAIVVNPEGRWPSNFVLSHTPDCKFIGMKDGKGYMINRFDDGAKPFGGGAGHEYTSEEQGELIEIWECSQDCPVRHLDNQSGTLKSGKNSKRNATAGRYQGNVYGAHNHTKPEEITYGDEGGASRFFYSAHNNIEEADPIYYCSKASTSEREAGIYEDNSHPTIKPIDLSRYLASLLLPPEMYAPRRIFVPFAGVASEMIGCWQAGWEEIIGVDIDPEYIPIAEARLDYWCRLRADVEAQVRNIEIDKNGKPVPRQLRMV